MANETPPYVLKGPDYLDLWKFFNEDTAKIKDKLWTIASWLYGIMGALLGTIITYTQAAGTGNWQGGMSILGIVLSAYTAYMIWEYGIHIRHGWNRANFIAAQIKGLKEIIDNDRTRTKRQQEKKDAEEKKFKAKPVEKQAKIKAKESQALPPFAFRLFWFAIGYGVVFSGLAVYFLDKL